VCTDAAESRWENCPTHATAICYARTCSFLNPLSRRRLGNQNLFIVRWPRGPTPYVTNVVFSAFYRRVYGLFLFVRFLRFLRLFFNGPRFSWRRFYTVPIRRRGATDTIYNHSIIDLVRPAASVHGILSFTSVTLETPKTRNLRCRETRLSFALWTGRSKHVRNTRSYRPSARDRPVLVTLPVKHSRNKPYNVFWTNFKPRNGKPLICINFKQIIIILFSCHYSIVDAIFLEHRVHTFVHVFFRCVD